MCCINPGIKGGLLGKGSAAIWNALTPAVSTAQGAQWEFHGQACRMMRGELREVTSIFGHFGTAACPWAELGEACVICCGRHGAREQTGFSLVRLATLFLGVGVAALSAGAARAETVFDAVAVMAEADAPMTTGAGDGAPPAEPPSPVPPPVPCTRGSKSGGSDRQCSPAQKRRCDDHRRVG